MKKNKMTRRQFLADTAVAGVAGVAALPAAQTLARPASAKPLDPDGSSKATLRVATCQFPVGAKPDENAKYIADFMGQAAAAGAHLLHTSEACLSGYAGIDFGSFDGFDWETLRKETAGLRQLARHLKLWLVLGSAHFLNRQTKPTNCLYLIDPQGKIVDRYDKCFCTAGDQKHYSAGDRLVTRLIGEVTLGLAICYDICWPQLYIGYREKNATVMLHSFYNAGNRGKNCLDVYSVRQAPTRCSDNRMWAVCNNSSRPYSHWGSFIARPDATIPKQLPINEPGMLIHDFPDGLSEGGWYHNHQPMQKCEDEIMSWSTPSKHPRQADGQAEP